MENRVRHRANIRYRPMNVVRILNVRMHSRSKREGRKTMSHRFLGLGLVVALLAGLLLLPVPGSAPRVQAQTGFYVAIAPYSSQTHPCTYHVKGSCQAELKGVTFRYWLRSTDGAVSRSGTVRTGADGFLEWWLPPNKRYVATFEYEGRRGTGTFSSFSKDPTCITTIQLQARPVR